MRLAEIRVHPIKSCRPVQRTSANVEARGLQHDRRYMIVDRTGTFVTLRTLPQLSFIDVAIGDADYGVQLPGGPSFAIPHEPVEGPWVRVGVWGDALWAREHVEAGALLSDWAGLPLRLVGMVEGTSERSLPGGGAPMSFADAWPLLCLSPSAVYAMPLMSPLLVLQVRLGCRCIGYSSNRAPTACRFWVKRRFS